MAWLNLSFESDALHMPVMLDVLIPQGRGNYQCLYLLHGAGGDHSSWLTKTRIADYVEGTNITVIMPSGNNKCYVNNKHGKDYFTFITEELIRKCETWFSLSNKKEDRFIAGMSMGAYGSLNAVLERPDLFSSTFLYSGLLDIIERYDHPQGLDLYPVFGTRDELIEDGYDLFEKSRKLCVSLGANVENVPEIFIFCGEEDPRIHMSTNMYQHLTDLGYKTHYSQKTGAHNFKYWDQCVKETVQIIQNGGENVCQ